MICENRHSPLSGRVPVFVGAVSELLLYQLLSCILFVYIFGVESETGVMPLA